MAERDELFDVTDTNNYEAMTTSTSNVEEVASTSQGFVQINVTQTQLRYMARIHDNIANNTWERYISTKLKSS